MKHQSTMGMRPLACANWNTMHQPLVVIGMELILKESVESHLVYRVTRRNIQKRIFAHFPEKIKKANLILGFFIFLIKADSPPTTLAGQELSCSACYIDVIDEIKSRLESACPGVVSCADVIALASRDAVSLLGGPAWNVPLGRKDARTANDMVALSSGAHTVGTAWCQNYRARMYGYDGEGNIIDPAFAEARRRTCHAVGGDDAVAPFDEESPLRFDNAYYRDLIARRGLLTSDQALYGCGGPFDNLVRTYSKDGERFARDFATAMVKMGNISPPSDMPVEVRLNCRRINY
ncbi:hypothetical protein PR202_ga16293 [Eleusine coracana subsp. coracana]|uniref:Peroxidase n=1 Tax=Eleusine coracana subsp. coracana TaxID=191504 RepID=A0AAV5CME6_ELECO|nr:hypothetical protein PR202_ga16293 [Eleusine coracana subsp. coracana]